MKRTAFIAASIAALFLTQATASADGNRDRYRMHPEPSVWTGHFRHMARHHHDWRHADMAGYRTGYYGSGYYEPDGDEDYGAASPYGYSAYGYPAYAGYSGCGGCGAVYSGCYSYGCRPAYPACGYYGGGCRGFLGYSRCGGC